MIEAELPDGTILEFPDGTSDEVIQRAVKRQLGQAPAQDGRPEGLADLSRGFLTRPVFEAVGGITGGVLGAGGGGVAGVAGGPAAPATVPAGAVAGGLAGGALGTAAGSITFDTVEDFLRFAGVLESDSPSLGERSLTALRGAAEDVAFAGGFQVAGQGFRALKPGLGKILGLRGSTADDIVRQAEDAGIPVGAVDVGTGTGGRILRGTARVLGIFPWIGGPFRGQAAVKADRVTQRMTELLDGLAPNATLSNELGVDMVEAAQGSIKEFRTTASRLYDNFENLAKDAGAIVPTNASVEGVPSIKEAAQAITDRKTAGRIILEDGTELKGPIADEMGDFIDALTKLPDNLTVAQYRELSGSLQDFVNVARAEGLDVSRFAELKQSMEGALSELRVSGVANGAEIVNALEAANNFYSKGITQFQTPTAQKFGRVDQNIFRPGPVRPGGLNDDELARVAVNLKSPKAINDLRALVGDDLMGQAARRHFETAWQDSILRDRGDEIIGFNWEKFSKTVGLSGKGENVEALRAFVKNSDVDIGTLKAVVDTASRIEVPRSVSQFVARRAALGGFSSAFAGVTTAGIIKDSLLGSVAVTILLRNFSKIISDPAQLKMMRRALQPDTLTANKRAFVGRLIEGLEEQVPAGNDNAGDQQPLRQSQGQ